VRDCKRRFDSSGMESFTRVTDVYMFAVAVSCYHNLELTNSSICYNRRTPSIYRTAPMKLPSTRFIFNTHTSQLLTSDFAKPWFHTHICALYAVLAQTADDEVVSTYRAAYIELGAICLWLLQRDE
jgi:hypothetical protein